MKKIGMHTARGQISETDTLAGRPKMVQLFDGSFKTAYRVVDFKIWGSNFGGTSTNPDVVGKLSTSENSKLVAGFFMNADDDNEIAWAASAAGLEGGGAPFADSIVDLDNLIIEDLYVYALSTGSATTGINYLIVMEKYSISEGMGALAMARDALDA